MLTGANGEPVKGEGGTSLNRSGGGLRVEWSGSDEEGRSEKRSGGTKRNYTHIGEEGRTNGQRRGGSKKGHGEFSLGKSENSNRVASKGIRKWARELLDKGEPHVCWTPIPKVKETRKGLRRRRGGWGASGCPLVRGQSRFEGKDERVKESCVNWMERTQPKFG